MASQNLLRKVTYTGRKYYLFTNNSSKSKQACIENLQENHVYEKLCVSVPQAMKFKVTDMTYPADTDFERIAFTDPLAQQCQIISRFSSLCGK